MINKSNWILPAIFALLLWGVWGFFQKLATNYMPPRQVYLFAVLGPLITGLAVLASVKFSLEPTGRGVLFAVLAGLAGSAGGLFFLYSLNKGKASLIITLTALYPVVTIILSFLILGEKITAKQGIGIVLALASMLLLVK